MATLSFHYSDPSSDNHNTFLLLLYRIICLFKVLYVKPVQDLTRINSPLIPVSTLSDDFCSVLQPRLSPTSPKHTSKLTSKQTIFRDLLFQLDLLKASSQSLFVMHINTDSFPQLSPKDLTKLSSSLPPSSTLIFSYTGHRSPRFPKSTNLISIPLFSSLSAPLGSTPFLSKFNPPQPEIHLKSLTSADSDLLLYLLTLPETTVPCPHFFDWSDDARPVRIELTSLESVEIEHDESAETLIAVDDVIDPEQVLKKLLVQYPVQTVDKCKKDLTKFYSSLNTLNIAKLTQFNDLVIAYSKTISFTDTAFFHNKVLVNLLQVPVLFLLYFNEESIDPRDDVTLKKCCRKVQSFVVLWMVESLIEVGYFEKFKNSQTVISVFMKKYLGVKQCPPENRKRLVSQIKKA
ncbi:hypothetical protein GEMRC1_006064 [Eukaryota sp. GEM-RC1]